LEEYYDEYVYYLRDYVKRMADNGAPIDIISVQNEPDISVTYDGSEWTPESMCDFVKNYIPLIREEIKPVKIMPGESFNFNRNMYESILNDPEAVKNIDIVGGHIYGGGLARYDNAIDKGKEVWMTEHLLNTSGNYSYDSTWPAVWVFAKDVHNSMALGHFSAFIWWHAKRFYSMIGDGSYNTIDGEILPRGYVLSHYAKYAAGKTRVAAEAAGDSTGGIYVTAYESGKDISLVLFNESDTDSGYVRIYLPKAVRSANGI
jgi:O-glycosyl hydrolase